VAKEEKLSDWEYGLLTDLYQLTMAACYVGEDFHDKPASFELFFRRLPSDYGYAIAMGLSAALDFLEKWRFSPKAIEGLRELDIFADAPPLFWELLANGRFMGDIWALPEGTAVFPHEPILRVEAPLWQAQIVETYLLNTINYQTLIATRAARVRDVAGEGVQLLEFGSRRAFSPQGALWAARSAIAGGIDATSNVLAALQLGVKPSGTMAHALVMAISAMRGTEMEAMEAFSRYFPKAALLVDTYDAKQAIRQLADRVDRGEMDVKGIRLDSGDLVELSRLAKELLPEAAVLASGDLDEYEIANLKVKGAKIDGFGLGTRLVTGTPINGVYKLVEIDGVPTAKKSPQKATYPGKKQIQRFDNAEGMAIGDRVVPAGNDGLLVKVMAKGDRLLPVEDLATIRQRTAKSVASLPPETRQILSPTPFPVTFDIPPF
jgi:nicotinate phosphoribosyltransferase